MTEFASTDEFQALAPTYQALIMAAGKGTRMRSKRPKVLHEILGRTMIEDVVDAAFEAEVERVIVIVGHGADQVRQVLAAHPRADDIHFALQAEQLGTGHAIWSARDYLTDQRALYTVILSGDVPNMDGATLARFIETSVRSRALVSLMTAVVDEPGRYGRIVRDSAGQVEGIVEFKDATEAQREIDEINAGFYVARTVHLHGQLEQICGQEPSNAAGEYYLTDVIARTIEAGERVFGWEVSEVGRIRGVNTRAHLAEAAAMRRAEINARWLDAGVAMADPSRVIIEASVELAEDVYLGPGVHLQGATRVGAGAVLEDGCVLRDSVLGEGVHLKPYCVLDRAVVDQDAAVGPFAHLRPGADVGPGCKVGNFVEVKKSRLDEGAKVSHLSYIGDAHVGAAANVGAGTITCNYDGFGKHATVIGEGAFIGSNTALVAPIKVGQGAIVAAGSTLTNDVPDDALSVARSRQENKDGWASRFRRRRGES